DELYLKRLIVGGLEKVYELSKDFRNEGYSYKHSPEFTQVEWYEAYADYLDTMERCEALVERVAQQTIGGTKTTFRGHELELANAFSKLNDSDEQAQRFAMQAGEREAGDVEAEPGDPDYVDAMSYGMAPNSGIGIGIDRLAMILLGRDSIRDVILFPALRE